MASAPTRTDLEVNFMTIPPKMINAVSYYVRDVKKPRTRKRVVKDRATPARGFPLLRLNPEMLMNVMDQLSVTDNACLALSCKYLASIASHHKALTIKAAEAVLGHIHDPTLAQWTVTVSNFFNRLKMGWVPRDGPHALGYCTRCSKFRPYDSNFWVEYGMKKVAKYGGLAGRNWGVRLRAWNGHPQSDYMIGDHTGGFSGWVLVCPACRIENP